MAGAALVAEGLAFRYGRGDWLVDGVSVSVPRGGLLRVRGGNGSGKSTLLHLLCGAVGVGAGLALHAGRVTRGVQTLVVVAGALLSARLPWLPPAGPLLSTWGAGETPGAAAATWALLGPVLVTAGLLALTVRLRHRR